MNREIKYRGICSSGWFVYGHYYTLKKDVAQKDGTLLRVTRNFIIPSDAFDLLASIEVDGKTIMQFTGLHDCNNKKIYEGDINQDKGVCFFDEKDASFSWKYPDDEIHEMFSEETWCTIIGNVYENPELIETK